MRFAAFLLVSSAYAQAPVNMGLISPSTASIPQGQPVTFAVFITGTNANTPSVQWSWNLPVGVTASVAIASSVAATGKSLSCGPLGCLIYGGANSLVDGTLASVTMQTTSATPIGSSITFGVASAMGADPNGNAVSISAHGYQVAITAPVNPCDLNSDGLVNAADLTLLVNAIVGAPPYTLSGPPSPSAYDLNKDGKVDIIDVQIVGSAVGGTCKAVR